MPEAIAEEVPTTPTRVNSWYGWRPDKPDIRDRRFAVRALPTRDLPRQVDLRDWMPPVYDQGSLGSCTANAIAGAIEYARKRNNVQDFMPSRLFIYYCERVMEDTVKEDAGAEIRDGIKAVAKLGAPAEDMWPYVISKFADKPPQEVYDAADDHLVGAYRRVDNSSMGAIKTSLAAGLPIVFGFSVYSGFESEEVGKNGTLQLPRESEKLMGGHAVLAVGYDDGPQRILVRNSWGADWGQEGYFTMPYAYAMNKDLSDDWWAIELSA